MTQLQGTFVTLPDVLECRAETEPDRLLYTFLIDGEKEERNLTVGELSRMSRAIAVALKNRGLVGKRALLLFPPGLDYIAGFLGCLYAGTVAVPAYHSNRRVRIENLERIVNDSGADVVLALSDQVSALRSQFVGSPTLRQLEILAIDEVSLDAAFRWKRPDVDEGTLAYLQYTSGSTMSPRGVMVSHGSLMANFEVIQNVVQFHADDRIVQWVPLHHDMGLINALSAVYHGCRSILLAPFHFVQRPYRWLAAVTRYRATVTGGPNFALDLCNAGISEAQRKTLDLNSLKILFCGAEPVRVDTLESFAENFRDCGFRQEALSPCYGLAEFTAGVCGVAFDQGPITLRLSRQHLADGVVVPAEESDKETDAVRLVGCGSAAPEHMIRIVRPETSVRASDDQIGEIWVAGASKSDGYWGHSDVDHKDFSAQLEGVPDAFLRTGDLGFIAQGQLFITGRRKDLIIISGKNHYPQDIENTVGHCWPTFVHSSCAAFMDEGTSPRLIVVQEWRPDPSEDRRSAIDAAIGAISRVHDLAVAAIVLVRANSIPRTTSGKIQRSRCAQLFGEGDFPHALAFWRGTTSCVS
jgi:acyl-CoA synthetase (AMP-forming)/AMP-acid ligase II